MFRIAELIKEIQQKHEWTPASNDADAEIAQFAARSGYPLPADMEAFYRQCSTASLLDGAFELLPLDRWLRVSEAIYGEEEGDDGCPDSWYAFCNARDGDYIGIVLVGDDPTPAKNILDCDHEDLTPANIIACSFTEFLSRTLDAGEQTYLSAGFRPYGTVTYEESAAYWRRAHAGLWNRMGPEVGPLTCDEPGCERLRVTHSTRCRRHHYEMLFRHPCPFPE